VGRGRNDAPVGAEIEEGSEDFGSGGPVDGGMVELGDNSEVAGLESFDNVHLPQRAIEVERPARHLAHEGRQLTWAAGRRDTGAADMEVKIEMGILDPDGMMEAERHPHGAPT
jgi:hypothetical protein